MAERLATIPGVRIVNDVVLNQVLVALPGGDDANRAAVSAIQRDGTCWLGGTTWNGRYVLRVSVSNWSTTDADIDRSAEAIARAAQPFRRRPSPRLHAMSVDRAALAVGGIRLASGISFLVDPLRANRLWGDPDEPPPTALLLLHSMGYRDALIGGLLMSAALRGKDTRGWFLASGGADAADLLGGTKSPPRDEALTAGHRPRRRGRGHRRRAVGRYPSAARLRSGARSALSPYSKTAS